MRRALRDLAAGWFVAIGMMGFLAAAASATNVYVTNINDNTVSQFEVSAGGALAPLSPASIAAGSGPNGIAVAADGRSAYVGDELSDAVSQYTIDAATGRLTAKAPATVPAGAGPFGLNVAASPDGRNLYVGNTSLGDFNQASIAQYSIDPTSGAIAPKAPPNATLPAAGPPFGLAVSPDSKHVYASCGALCEFGVAPTTGVLSADGDGFTNAFEPFAVAVAPNGRSAYVTAAFGIGIQQYDIDPATGQLSPKTPSSVPAGSGGEGIAVSPDGKSVYATSGAPDAVWQYDVDPATGALHPKTPSSVPAGGNPIGIAVDPDNASVYVADNGAGAISQYDIDADTRRASRQDARDGTGGLLTVRDRDHPAPANHRRAHHLRAPAADRLQPSEPSPPPSRLDHLPSADRRHRRHGTIGRDREGAVHDHRRRAATPTDGCTLRATRTASAAGCVVNYTATATPARPLRTDTLTARYSGDAVHPQASASTAVKVLSLGFR